LLLLSSFTGFQKRQENSKFENKSFDMIVLRNKMDVDGNGANYIKK
jgi:hypothetical protein